MRNRTWQVRTGILVVTLLIGAILGIYLSVGGDQPLAVLYAARQNLEKAGSHRIHIVQTFDFPDKTRTFESFLDVGAPDRMRLIQSSDLTLKGIRGPIVVEGCGREEMIVVENKFYQRCDDGPWSVQTLEQSPAFDPMDTAAYGQGLLAALRDVREVGDDVVDGILVRVFEGRLDAAEEAERRWPGDGADLPPEASERRAIRKATYAAEATLTTKVYIGKDDLLVRRIKQDESYPGSPVDDSYTSHYVATFSDYHASIPIEPPKVD